MRTVVKTEVIPATEAEEVQYTTYGCDHCDFESENKEQVELHHGEKHACKKKLEIGTPPLHRTLYWFDTEDDAKAFLEAECGDFYRSDGVSWSEPGWYVKTWAEKPCARGCCRDDYLGLKTIESELWNIRYEAKQLMQRHAEIRKAILEEAERCRTS